MKLETDLRRYLTRMFPDALLTPLQADLPDDGISIALTVGSPTQETALGGRVLREFYPVGVNFFGRDYADMTAAKSRMDDGHAGLPALHDVHGKLPPTPTGADTRINIQEVRLESGVPSVEEGDQKERLFQLAYLFTITTSP